MKAFVLSIIRPIIGLGILLLSTVTLADSMQSYEFDDAAQEARYKTLIQELRCLVCQNQNLADSNADLALDLRRQTYEMISQGKSNADVVDYMVTRYGDFVLYRPRFSAMNALLWLGPFIFLLIGLLIAIKIIRKGPQAAVIDLSRSDHERAEALLSLDADSGLETKKKDEETS